jgi:hypothetical protein
MAYGIKKPRRWSWLAEYFRREKARKIAVILLVVVVALSLFAVWWGRELSQYNQPPPSSLESGTLPEEETSWAVSSAYARAEILIRKAQANEYRGRIGEVADLWREAYFLLDRIRRADPSFQAAEVAEKTLLCENKLRKLK